jgi:alpha-1,2-mannosyltransferase
VSHRPPLRFLPWSGLLVLAGAAGLYAAAIACHPLGLMLTGFDLRVYRGAGLLVGHGAARLYGWQLRPGARFTYPPFAALLFAGVAALPWPAALWLMAAASMAALAGTVWLTAGQLGWAGRSRLGLAAAVTAAAFWTEPVQRALHLGQVELLLMALVVWDLGQPAGRRCRGAGIGLAAGVKLVPLIFIPYLLLTRRFRPAAVASGVFASTAALGWAVLPQASARWWLGGDFLTASRTGFIGFQANQSLRGLLTRLAGGTGPATAIWLGLAALTAAAGLLAAARLHAAGRPVAGWLTCALTGLLVSPISWDHHWVWLAPALVLLADAARRGTPRRLRRACWAALGLLGLAFGGWPSLWRPAAPLVPWGLIWYPPGTSSGLSVTGQHPEYTWTGMQLLAGNLYVLCGLLLFAGLLAAAARCAPRTLVLSGQTTVGQTTGGGADDRADGQAAGAAGAGGGHRPAGPAGGLAGGGRTAGDQGGRAAA